MAVKVDKFAAFIKEAKRLRTSVANAEYAFFMHLKEGEDGNIILGTKYDSFLKMLRDTNICDPARYDRFKVVLASFGPNQVREVGLDGVIQVNRIPKDAVSRSRPGVSARVGALKEMKEFEKRNQVPVSRHHAETIVKKHFVPERVEEEPTSNTPKTPLEKSLDRENRRLKVELRNAYRKIEDLESKLTKAESKLAKHPRAA
jgi:hypothetical protein